MLRCAWRLDFWAEIGNGASGATSGRPYCFPRCWASFFCWRPILKKPHKPAVGVFRMENLKRSRAGGFSLMSKSRKLAVSLQGGLWFALCVLLALSTPPRLLGRPGNRKAPRAAARIGRTAIGDPLATIQPRRRGNTCSSQRPRQEITYPHRAYPAGNSGEIRRFECKDCRHGGRCQSHQLAR